MKKLILLFILFISVLGITFANENNGKLKVNLDIINNEVENNYSDILFDPYNKNHTIFYRINNNINNLSIEKTIYFYNRILNLSKTPAIYQKHKKTIDVLNYMFTIKIVKSDIEKEYVYSKENWDWYINKEVGFKIMYPLKYKDGSKRDIIERGNMLHISYDKKHLSYFKEKLKTENNYYLSSRYPNTYVIEDNIENDDDISLFLDKVYGNYGKECSKFEKIETKQEGLYIIKFTGVTSFGEKDSCQFTKYNKGLYSEKLKKIITWHLSQSICDIDSPFGACLVLKNTFEFLD